MRQLSFYCISAVIAALICIADWRLPSAGPIAALYALAIVACAFSGRASGVLVAGVVCSALASVDLWPTVGVSASTASASIAISVFVIWLTVGLAVRNIRLLHIVRQQEIQSAESVDQQLHAEIANEAEETRKSRALASIMDDLRVEREKLQASEERFRATVESAPLAMVMVNSEGRVSMLNAEAEKLFGYERSEVLGQFVEMLLPERHRQEHPVLRDGFVDNPSSRRMGDGRELFARHKDGSEIPVEIGLSPLQLADGLFVLSAITDISQRKHAEQMRAFHSALVDSSYDAIIGKDIAGRITSWNAGAQSVYGYVKEEMLGKSVRELLPEGTLQEEEEIVRAMETGERLEQFETERLRKDGEIIPVSITVSPIVDATGRIIGSSAIERDITESRLYEEELEDAKETAEQATKTRAEFLANVSHELRTPMNAIIGMTQLALEESLSDTLREYIGTANDSAHALLTLLNDILDFSKLEAGRFTIEATPFRLREMLDVTIKAYASHAFEKGLEFNCEIGSDVPNRLVGDATRLRQIVTNLVSNAIKFTDEGEVLVSVSVREKAKRKCVLKFSVRDTGIGIPEEYHEKVLEPFTQVDASASRQYGGTGLGLAICHELLQMMGGSLALDSEPGAGSCFWFEIPLPFKVPKRSTHKPTIAEELRGRPVLVVDDSQTNRRILAETLMSWSIAADVAATGSEALQAFHRRSQEGLPYSIAIIDAVMPEMDGLTLATQLQQLSNNECSAILMVSSADRLKFKDQRIESTFACLLQKPVSQSDLLDALMRAADSSEAESSDQADDRPSFVEKSRPLSVMLVEDTVANQKVAVSILTKYGHEVTLAQNGSEAVELYRPDLFDVVLMDIQMPVMDGYQATAAIRAREQELGQRTPIVAMTAHAMRGDREKCLDAGMDDYIAKPVDVSELLSVVARVVHQHSDEHDDDSFVDGLVPATAAPVDEDSASQPFADLESVIDIEGALRRINHDHALFRELVQLFREDAPNLLAELQRAVANENWPEAGRFAHSLKGLVSNFGADGCVSAAIRLEAAIAVQAVAEIKSHLGSLERELQIVFKALESHAGESI